MKIKIYDLILASLFAVSLLAAEVPVVRSTDVVVVGGSTAAVSAALSAKAAGADVFLLAPRPYLGEDVAGTLRVVRDPSDDPRDPLFRTIFAPQTTGGWPFTYRTDVRPNPQAHSDRSGKDLADGKCQDAARESVQYPDDVTVTMDLGEVRVAEGVTLVSFYRSDNKKVVRKELTGPNVGYCTKEMLISVSEDGTRWSQPATVTKYDGDGEHRIFTWDRSFKARFLRVKAIRAKDYPRQLLGEIVVRRPVKDDTELASRTTPFIVKRTLDRAMLAAGVPYLTGTLVCDVLKDSRGQFAGVVMANRSGRQIVRAKVLIDATERATPARLAGGVTVPFMPGTYVFHRVVVSGTQPIGAGVTAQAISEPFRVNVRNHLKPKFPLNIEARFWDCTISIPMKDGTARSFAAAEQLARDRTFTVQQVDAANTLTLMAPDHFTCRASVAVWKDAESFDLDAMRPKQTTGVWVVGPLADVSRPAASQLSKPGHSLRLGARVGRAAAVEAKSLTACTGALVSAAAAKAAPLATGARLGEHHGELPSYLVNAKGTVPVPDNLTVLATCDTFVVGAGTGGAPAGIAAARHGAKTIVGEYLYVEGGVETDGLIGYYYFGNRVGFTDDIDKGVRATGSVFPQSKSEWYRSQQRKAGAEIWFGVFVNGVVISNGRVTGVVVVMADGTRGLVRCANAIDATGNAELPAMAGEETEFITDEDLSVQGVGLARNTMGTGYANSDIGFCDDTDAADVFYFALRSRLSLPEGTWDQAQVINSRERRRMIGAFYMSASDVVCGRTYPDIITRTFSNFDSHGQTRDDLFFIQDPGHKPMYVNLPYRCLLPKKLEGLLVTGLGISAHRDAMPILRMQPDIQNQGYAAGTAAAMAVKGGTMVRDIDIKALQHHLVDMKILTQGDLSMKDNFPLSNDEIDTAVAELADNYKGLPIIMTDRARALPRIQGAFQSAEGESKTIYAHVLALLGKSDGEAQLLAKFKSTPWDKGWNYRGMGQFNRSVSWVDSYAIALGHCKSKAAVPALIEKAAQLTERSEYSHFRAIARALEEIGDKSAIPVLADILKRRGIGGRWQTMGANPPVVPGYQNAAGDWERTLSLRELCIARALYRLGDTPDKLGQRTLEAYAADPRRTYAKHAKLVLGK
ncbi:MAG: FAD-dependent oxidoreductase [Kiritimatiellae bacterium]|nr:FAD-dependent oxidoreductase [Kiritimatiellia bacterium]